ncbi:hypothetical protein PR048_015478 [Dryococelus australis]|uniref:DUF4371 domain-containing protein n=1 Tax=Dryococelus australis TaxID=614101 RepID=A0ABQ9HHK4_9NEOP|nr:hypothetical protein PR048_015478 [Dryococelus australis]
MTILVRFVYVKCSDGAYGVKICEDFLGFVPVADATSSTLTNTVLEFLEKMNIPSSDMRGQGYDNGANTKGKHYGLQKIILDMNERVFYMPCSSHSVNIVLNDSPMSSQYAVTLNHVLSITLNPINSTRWESSIDDLTPLRYQIGQVYNALVDTGEIFDSMTAHETKSMANLIKDYTFLSSLVIWYDVLIHINVVSKSLQSITSDDSDANCMIRKTNEYFEKKQNRG